MDGELGSDRSLVDPGSRDESLRGPGGLTEGALGVEFDGAASNDHTTPQRN